MNPSFESYPDDAEKRMEKADSDLLDLARDALDIARRNSNNFDVCIYTLAVLGFATQIPDGLIKLETDENELGELEQKGFESAARMHLNLARSEARQNIRRKNVATLRRYARLSERPLTFFGTDEDELQRLSK